MKESTFLTLRSSPIAKALFSVRYELKVSALFALGGLFGAVPIAYEEILEVFLWWIIPMPGLVGYALGGAISGLALGRGLAPVISFGLSFALLGLVVPSILLAPQGFSGNQSTPLAFAVMFAECFGIVGLLGSSGLSWKWMLVGGPCFAVAGAIGGAIVGMIVDMAIECRAAWSGMWRGWLVAGLTLPHALAGGMMAVLLGYPARRRRRLGLCLECGYDLHASVDRCPECGEPFPRE